LWGANNSVVTVTAADPAVATVWQTDHAGAGARVIAFVERTRQR
jgi:hypothetical protein